MKNINEENINEKRRREMGKGGMNIGIEPVLTKEQIEYNDALRNLKYVTARLRLSQEGINTDNISQQKLETVIKLFDEMDSIQRDFNVEMQTIQQEVDNKTREFQANANKKFGDAQNRYKELINSMKSETEKKKITYEDAGVSRDKIAQAEDAFAKSLGIEIKDKKEIDISEEKAKEIQKMLADELAKSQKS